VEKMPERRIGRVVSVDSFRVIIELDSEIKGPHKSGYYDLYEIAKINSYVIIPVADEKIVAIVTRVKINDETEIESYSGTITLPKSKRYIIATMTGTINGNKHKEYIQGVYDFPILDNPVWYVMEDDLKVIFDYKEAEEPINFKDDYFLPIGISPVFNNFEVKINPDKFFCKHAAILGNTGSGKSCTVATILQSIFSNKYKVKNEGDEEEHDVFVNNAHFIIFDTNGEYKRAFEFSDQEIRERVNAFTINSEGLKVPYWFMNYEDFDYLFKPSANTQAPILKRAIALAKGSNNHSDKKGIDSFCIRGILEVLDCSPEELKKRKCKSNYGNWNFDPKNEIVLLAENIEEGQNSIITDVKRCLLTVGTCTKDNESNALEKLKTSYNIYLNAIVDDKISENNDIDLPKWFDFKVMMENKINDAISEQEVKNNKLNEFLSTLKLRLNSFYSDERFNNHFILQSKKEEILFTDFIQYLMGILEKNQTESIYSNYKYKDGDCVPQNIYSKIPKNQITIIDMSLLPFEVLENVTGLIGRIILEFLSRFDKAGLTRGSVPTVIVLEEAQNYIPEKDRDTERISISKRVFERIAREGRKFGLSLLVSSQRPSELSKTILSQCNTFIVHRLQNPDDQKYIKQIVSSANEDILNQLPVLPQQHAIIMGDAVRSPIQVKLRDVKPKPKSENPEYFNNWTQGNPLSKEMVDKVVESWIGKGDSTKNHS
jgi:DNA helicase HerA-like ATPase